MMIQKKADSSTPLLNAIAERWSGRAFDAERFIPDEDLRALLEAARWAPSSMNAQPWRFLTLDRERQPEAWKLAFESLAPSNQTWAGEAPTLLVVSAETQLPKGGNNPWAAFDTGAAMMALSLEACHRHLMIHPMGGFDGKKLISNLKLPGTWTPLCIAAIGFQLSQEKVPSHLHERELAERTRNPLDSIWFSPEALNR